MARKAYFMVDVAEKHLPNGFQDILRDLEAIPEVKSIERISGTCDLMVQVEIPASNWTIFTANKLLAKGWVKRLQVLNVEPLRADEYPKHYEEAFINAEHL